MHKNECLMFTSTLSVSLVQTHAHSLTLAHVPLAKGARTCAKVRGSGTYHSIGNSVVFLSLLILVLFGRFVYHFEAITMRVLFGLSS